MADVVVLLPGLGRGPEDFDQLAGRLRDAGFDVPAYDPRPGFESEPARPGITMHDIAADVAALIEAHGGTAHLVGHAFGNRVARCVAADRPDLVRSVTLLAAGGLVAPSGDVVAAMRSRDPGERASVLFAPGRTPSGWGRSSSATAAAQTAATAATPVGDWWLGGRAPILVIQGLDDVVAVPENGRRLVAEIGDRGRLVEIAYAGHALVVEQPDAIAQALIPFLASPTT